MAYDNLNLPLLRMTRMGYVNDATVRADADKIVWGYATTDTPAVVETTGYFNACLELGRGDMIDAVMNCTVGFTPVKQTYLVIQGIKSGDANNVIAAVSGSSMQTLFGGGSGSFSEQGNLVTTVSGGTSPASIGGDIVVANFALPASSFDKTGRGVTVFAAGGLAANANTKRAKLIFGATTANVGSAIVGGTTICDTGASVGNNVGWQLVGALFKYGAAGSNTQWAQNLGVIVGASHSGMGVPQLLTLSESGTINLSLTINCTTAVTDAAAYIFEVNGNN